MYEKKGNRKFFDLNNEKNEIRKPLACDRRGLDSSLNSQRKNTHRGRGKRVGRGCAQTTQSTSF